MSTAEKGFSGRQAAEIVGITYRQLDYWARTDLIRPSLADATGSGSRRSYSYRDLLELKVVKNLLDAGIKLESVRDAFAYLRNHLDEDVTTANLVINGRGSVVVSTGEELVDLIRRGQGVLNILPAGQREERGRRGDHPAPPPSGPARPRRPIARPPAPASRRPGGGAGRRRVAANHR